MSRARQLPALVLGALPLVVAPGCARKAPVPGPNTPVSLPNSWCPAGQVTPIFFGALATTIASRSQQSVFISGYSSPHDGGEGRFDWNPTSVANPDNGTVVQVSGVTTGRWHRVTDAHVFDVRHFGATGNGSRNDTVAIGYAAAAFSSAISTGGASELYFPGGTYAITPPLTFAGVIGGVIRGDGEGITTITTDSTYDFTGAEGVIVRKNCQKLTIESMTITEHDYSAAISGGGISAGATSVTFGAGAPVVAGKRVTLAKANGAAAEIISVVNVAGSVATFATPTLYSYTTSDYILTGALAGITDYTDGAAINTNNRVRRVTVGSASLTQFGAGFATDCLGGGPTYVTSPVTRGAGRTVSVHDASQIVPGLGMRFWSNPSTPSDRVTVQSVNYLANVVTMTATIPDSFAPGALLVSNADANNDEHIYEQATALNNMQAGWLIIGWNSDDLKMMNCISEDGYATVSARTGGNFNWSFGVVDSLGVDFEYGGVMTHRTKIIGAVTEAASKLLVTHSVDKTQNMTIQFDHYDKLGSVASGDMIEVTGSGTHLDFHSCNLAAGASAGLTATLTDTTAGTLTLTGRCETGLGTLTLTGFQLDDYGTTWTTPPTPAGPTEILTNSHVQSYAAVYGRGPVSRVSRQATVLSNGTNADIPTQGDAVLIATGPTAGYSLDGFTYGANGQTIRVLLKVNQAVTVRNNSNSEATAANRILTPTGADMTMPAPGRSGYVYAQFLYDGPAARWRFLP
jgi:hypothetical protein